MKILDQQFEASIWANRGTLAKSTRPEYYVYVLVRHNGDRIYIGKGKGRRSERDFTKEGENYRLANLIKRDRADGNPEPQVSIARRDMTEADAFRLESALIKQIGRVCNGGTLVNMTDGGPGLADGVERERMAGHFERIKELAKRNQHRQAILSLSEHLRQINIRADSARGVVLTKLYDGPATMAQLCERIGRMPALGDKGNAPAVTSNVYAALRHIRRKSEECSKFRIVETDGVYSVIVAPEYA